MDKAIKSLINKAKRTGLYEDFGQKEYRAFRDKVDNDDRLAYAEKVELCSRFSERVSSITDEDLK